MWLHDEKDKPPCSYAPVYAALYPEFAELAKEHSYALAIHGSLRRDFDLIAIPWVEQPSKPKDLVDAITSSFAIDLIGEPTEKFHGRTAWTISIGHGQCALDLSFMPTKG